MTYIRTSKIQRLGNSQAVLVNSRIREILQFNPGVEVISEIQDNSLVITRGDMMSKKKEVDTGESLKPAETVAPVVPPTPEAGRIEKRIERLEGKLDEISKKIDAKKETGPPAEEIPDAPIEPGPINIIEDDPGAPIEPNETIPPPYNDDGFLL